MFIFNICILKREKKKKFNERVFLFITFNLLGV